MFCCTSVRPEKPERRAVIWLELNSQEVSQKTSCWTTASQKWTKKREKCLKFMEGEKRGREGGKGHLFLLSRSCSAATLKRQWAGKSAITHFSSDTYAPTHTADIIAAFLRNASGNVRCDCTQSVCKCIFQAYLCNTGPEVSFMKYSFDPLFSTKETGGSGERGAAAAWILYLWTPGGG